MSDYVASMRRLVGTRPLFIPGVRALIFNPQEEILLMRRLDMPRWCLPSGGVELGEAAFDALCREVAEETSLAVLDAEPMALYSGPSQRFAYPNGDEVCCFAVAFLVRQWEGVPRPDGVEGSELRFFPLGKLPQELVPLHKTTIEDYKSYQGVFLLR